MKPEESEWYGVEWERRSRRDKGMDLRRASYETARYDFIEARE